MSKVTIEDIRAFANRETSIERELRFTNELNTDLERVLAAIPECPVHGRCIPHALDWIEKAKALMEHPCKPMN